METEEAWRLNALHFFPNKMYNGKKRIIVIILPVPHLQIYLQNVQAP
jgi:hypothetical protein